MESTPLPRELAGEARLSALARQLAEAERLARLGSWEWDIPANRITWSDELYRIFGVPVGESIDLDGFLAKVHPEDRGSVRQNVAAALETGARFEFTHRAIDGDGGERLIHARGEVIADAAGRPAMMRGTAQDVTERVATERKAQRLAAEHAALEAAQVAERRMEFLARASAELASSLDYQQTLRTIAQLAVPEIADWCAVDLIEGGELRRLAVAHIDPAKVAYAAELQERYPQDPDAPQGVHNVIRTGQAEMMEEIPDALLVAAAVDEEHLRIIRELGLRSYISAPLSARGRTFGALSLIFAESGRRYGPEMLRLAEDLARRAGTAIDNARLVHDLEDAHERVQEQAAELEIQAEEVQRQNDLLESHTRQLEVALSARSDFMATVSHELRTPLNAIMGYTQLIELGVSGDVNEAVLSHVNRIGLSARHLLQLIDDILTFSALDAGREVPRAEELRIGDMLDEVRAIIEPIAARGGLEFSIETAGAPASIHTDGRKLRQILLNLLGNAVKFTSRGRVGLAVRREGAWLDFEVADTGMGIPPEEQHRLFEPYWQSEETRAKRVGGAGLGLSISQQFAQLMGGELLVRSTPGQGSVFTLRLPAAPAAG